MASSQTYRALKLAPGTLRENILVDGREIGHVASGDQLRFGGDVEMVATFACEPCGKLERRSVGLSSKIGRERGMLARVSRGGVLQQGDEVWLMPAAHPPLSDDWRERVLQVLQKVPAGNWVTYSRLAELAGVSAGYCRAFPRLLSTLPQEIGMRARPADSAARRSMPWDGDGLYDASSSDKGTRRWI